MSVMNYEAWYEEEQIYNGTSKSEMINEILEFVESRTFYIFDNITENEIRNLDKKALSEAGIKLFTAKW